MVEITIRNIRKEYGSFVAVQNSSFTISDGDFFMLLGPSGCGKTTTLRMIAGLEMPTSGQIVLGNDDITDWPASQRDIAFVFQMFALYPHMNVYRNMAYPLISQGKSRSEVRRKVHSAAEMLRITHLLESPVSRLSGGDSQRVALGRALVREPKAFLMDEPLGALDTEFRERMADELRTLHDRMQATTVYVTHDQLEAMQMGDKIVVMNHGVIEQIGTPREIYQNPKTMFVADFIGSPPMNLLQLREAPIEEQAGIQFAGPAHELPGLAEGALSKPLVLGVRPEHVCLRDHALSGLRAQIEASEYLGTTQIVTCKTDLGQIRARIPSKIKAVEDENVWLTIDANRISLFDAESGQSVLNRIESETQDG